MSKIRITKKFRFEAAHALYGYDGKCKNIHGHNYKLFVTVIGVPVKASISLDGWDSILSILQMPGGVPVATVALNNAQNAGILAAQILALSNEKIAQDLKSYKQQLKEKVFILKLLGTIYINCH